MSKETRANKEGPILTPMDWVPGDAKNHSATGGGVNNGIEGYPKGTPTKLPELAFDNSGEFGKVKKAEG